jgi:hypothetical protein
LSSNPSVISVENPISFNDLTLQIIEEEQYLFRKHGRESVVAAVKDFNSNVLLTRMKDASKEMRQICQNFYCTCCNRKGYLDIDDQYRCFNRSENEKYCDAFKGKYYRENDRDNDSKNAEKKQKIEKHDFT